MSFLNVTVQTTYREDKQWAVERTFVSRSLGDIWNIYVEHPNDERGKGVSTLLAVEKERSLLLTIFADNNEVFTLVYLGRDGVQNTEKVTSTSFSDSQTNSDPRLTFVRNNGDNLTVELYSHKGAWEAWAPGSVINI